VTDPRFRTEHDSRGEVAVPARPTQGVPQMPSPRADTLQRTSAGAGCIQAPVECTLAPASCCWAAALSASTSASSCADPRCSMGREPRRDDHTTRPPPTPSSRCAHTPPPHPTSPDLVRTFRPDAEQNPRSATPQSRQHRKRVPSQDLAPPAPAPPSPCATAPNPTGDRTSIPAPCQESWGMRIRTVSSAATRDRRRW
jgi:hypothetical protein